MDSERFKKLEEIYHSVLGVAPEERKLFLEDKCGEDVDLIREVNEMLAFELDLDSFIDNSPGSLVAEIFSKEGNSKNLINQDIGHYQVQKILGEGGMGTVYLARDSKLARLVALKVLPSEMVENKDRVQRFIHEARAASALNHPHIMTIYEIDQFQLENGEMIHYISMEYIEGTTLQDLIYRKKTPIKELLKYLTQSLRGLVKAHSAGIIHRDLKPENIMVTSDGYAKILDFGLAKLTDKESELNKLQEHKSRPGVILGTLGYMSPEQAKGKRKIDERSDIFSFGCILYEAITKQQAFGSETTIDSLHKIIHSDPIPITDFLPEISVELKDLIEKCLQKNPDERFRNTGDIETILQNLLTKDFDEVNYETSPEKQKTAIFDNLTTHPTISQQFSEQRRQVTVMFGDVSAISETLDDLDPEESAEIMDGLWDFLDEVVVSGGGRVGERLTDTFIALWGTDAAQESDPEKAVRTSFELQKELRNYFSKNLSREIDLLEIEKEKFEQANFLKIGISTGTILLGQSKATQEFMTSGSAVNIAKRLLSVARFGEILISHETYRHIRGVFEVREVQQKVKQLFSRKNQERKVYSVESIKPRSFRIESRGVEGIETIIIGREAELSKMLSSLDEVSEDNELQTITIVGEAGLGKSRLLFEFQDRIELLPEKYYIFRARALETMLGLPFALVRDLFSFRFKIQESDSNEVTREKFTRGILEITADTPGTFGNNDEAEMKVDFIGQLIGFDFSDSPYIKRIKDDEKQIQSRALNYSAQFFGAVSRKFPLIIFLDDLHWADDQSIDFFDFVARRCRKEAILITECTRPILFERRPHWGEGEETRMRLDLQHLTKRESRKLIENILQKTREIPNQLKDLLISNAEGNPFYVEELIKMLVEQGVIGTTKEEWTIDTNRLGEISIPPTLKGVLESRLDKLSVWERRILQRASIIGREFWDSALKNFESEINVPVVLDSLRKKELLFRKENSAFDDANEYTFKHAVLRDVTYDTVLLDERRKWHSETAEWLIETGGERKKEYLSTIAEHFEKAQELDKSAEWFGKAGEQDLKSFASEAAEIHFSKALDYRQSQFTQDESDHLGHEFILKWKNGLGRAFYNQAKFSESISAYEEMLEIAENLDDDLSQATAWRGLSISQFENGETRSSLESAKKVVALMEDPDLGIESRFVLASGLYRQGRALMSLGQFQEAISCAEKVFEISEEFDDENSVAKANSLHLLSGSYMMLGNLKDAKKFEEREIEISRKSGDKRTVGNGLNSLGVISHMQGQAERAIEYYNEALEIAREMDNKSGEIMILSNIGGAKVSLGKYIPAEEELKKLIKEVGEKGHFLLYEMYRFLTEALIGQDKFHEALETANKTFLFSVETENQEATGEAWRVLGIVSACLKSDILIGEEKFSAAYCFEKSIQTFIESNLESNYAKALNNFAQYNLNIGNIQQAEDLFRNEKEISDRLDINTEANCLYFRNQNIN